MLKEFWTNGGKYENTRNLRAYFQEETQYLSVFETQNPCIGKFVF